MLNPRLDFTFLNRRVQKLSDEKQESLTSIDRLSDDLLIHILSRLPLELSATTSILGRRWRFLWARVPDLVFDNGNYRSRTRFADIINRVLMLHKGHTINYCYLYHDEDDCSDYEYHDSFSDYDIETWIATLIACNIRKLILDLHRQVMPRCLFTCKTLVDLYLTRVDIHMTGTIYFPSLKRLCLDMVIYESDECVPNMLSGCRVLEEFTLNMVEEMTCCCICSPTLNRLVIDSEYDEYYDDVFMLKLDTPALRYLHLDDSMFEDFAIGELNSLTEANINFRCIDPFLGDFLYSHSVLVFVRKLHNVELLQLSTHPMDIPDSTFNTLTMKFHNLTKLHLAADIRFIPMFLENADNLEVLSITMINVNDNEWVEPHQVPTCLLLHLKTVRIHQFDCREDEFELIRYLLMNAELLKLMTIYSLGEIDMNVKFDALKRISKFQRGSRACELDFL